MAERVNEDGDDASSYLANLLFLTLSRFQRSSRCALASAACACADEMRWNVIVNCREEVKKRQQTPPPRVSAK